MPPAMAPQKPSMKTLVVVEKNDQLVAGARAAALQMAEDLQRTPVQVAIGDLVLEVFARQVADVLIDAGVVLEQFEERVEGLHRVSSRYMR